MLRLALAAVVLMAIWRPTARGLRGTPARDVLLFGIALAGMNTSFYLALDRIPLGIGVTLEFVGPLGIAFAFSRRRAGPRLGSAGDGGHPAARTGARQRPRRRRSLSRPARRRLLGGYIVLSERVGRTFEGGDGLALAMAVAG